MCDFNFVSVYLSKSLIKRVAVRSEIFIVSLIHCAISGFGSAIALCDSKIWNDLINYYSVTGSRVIQFSTGYFIFDLFAILENSNFDLRLVHANKKFISKKYFKKNVGTCRSSPSGFIVYRDFRLLWLLSWFFVDSIANGNKYNIFTQQDTFKISPKMWFTGL